MIPIHVMPDTPTQAFLTALQQQGFAGEIDTSAAQRAVYATDNSIYERPPQAIVCPQHVADLQVLTRLLAEERFRGVVVTARGGGTGTNGQSLTEGIVVDVSRHMNHILSIDVAKRQVRVQAGVVKDQLNRALKPHGLFFAPELSTSNRATIGGMVNTDASGQGSCTYGKTRDHVLALKTVLWGGEVLQSQALSEHTWRDDITSLSASMQQRFYALHELVSEHQDAIQAAFPNLNRCLTGYDLPHVLEQGRFNLNSVLCGAEGSLGLVAEATLNVLPIPTERVLVNISYAHFQEALRDASALMAMQPLSIETVDSKVLGLAKADIVWQQVAEFFPEVAGQSAVMGINLVEFVGDDVPALQAQVARFVAHLQADAAVTRLNITEAWGSAAVERVYAMRKRSVGLLGNVEGERRPQPFVEDTAVPPENLAAYIAEFRALLDGMQVDYGMFGHVDAGVLHVRPALDMKNPQDAAKIKPITDQVAALVHKHGGVLWGEHGKGLRSEYAPQFFGAVYPLIQQVKAIFDPYNQFNPGKIATPSTQDHAVLTRVDEVSLRGQLDQVIKPEVWHSFHNAVHCNGNGACYNYDENDAMCPSWKAMRDRVHSPKGRASLMKTWLRQQGDVLGEEQAIQSQSVFQNVMQQLFLRLQAASTREQDDFSHQVHDAMRGCLSCKSCAGQCPVKVNVPDFKARFLQLYHHRYPRPWRDYAIAQLEYALPVAARFPKTYQRVMDAAWMKRLQERVLKLVDAPVLHEHSVVDWAALGATLLSSEQLSRLDTQRYHAGNSVLLVQDAFTRYFDTAVWLDWIRLLQTLGIHVLVLPFHINGKALQVHGFLGQFQRLVARNTAFLEQAAATGITMVGLDPAMTLVYRQEYPKALKLRQLPFDVCLPQEYLATQAERLQAAAAHSDVEYVLAGHCTEKTNAPESSQQWQNIFAWAGLTLRTVQTGCCGMSGTYGHEAEHQALSAKIYAQSWQPMLEQQAARQQVLATGYSCRSQVKRYSQLPLQHPLQALLQHLNRHPNDNRRTP